MIEIDEVDMLCLVAKWFTGETLNAEVETLWAIRDQLYAQALMLDEEVN